MLGGSPALATSRMFDADRIMQWDSWEFEGRTAYAPVSVEHGENIGADRVIRARCDESTASGLINRGAIDLVQNPVLRWHWRVDHVYRDLDETAKSGDDYPARIYVVAQRWPRWRSRVINYVWSSSQPKGSSWPNAYADQFVMLAIESGPEHTGQWKIEQRDVRRDFKRLHDLDVEQIDAIAIMTDCDNTSQQATAWYGPIGFQSR